MSEPILDEETISKIFEDFNQENLQTVADESLLDGGSSENVQESSTNRFARMTESDISQFMENQKNQNTKRKTESDILLFRTFLEANGEFRLPEFIPPSELASHISRFLLSVRKKDGSQYEPTSIRSFFASIDRHLREKKYQVSIISDIQFSCTRDALKSKQKELKSIGKGNKPKTSDPISASELDEMYKKKALGPHNARSLLHSMWLMCTLHFGMRTGRETHELKWGDVELKIDEHGEEYVTYIQERQTKTRTGSNPRDVRAVKPRAYSTGDPERCPVAQYKLFQVNRPEETLDPDAPFFLAINPKGQKLGKAWYKINSLGINKLYGIMAEMKTDAGIESDKKLTPYSVRKHLVQTLSDEGVPANQIVQISGHKNVNSINSYSKINPQQSKDISHILSHRSTHTDGKQMRPIHSDPSPSPSREQCSGTSGFPSGFFSGNTISGSINVYFQSTSSQQSNQYKLMEMQKKQTPSSPPLTPPTAQHCISGPRKFRRIRVIEDSDTD